MTSIALADRQRAAGDEIVLEVNENKGAMRIHRAHFAGLELKFNGGGGGEGRRRRCPGGPSNRARGRRRLRC